MKKAILVLLSVTLLLTLGIIIRTGPKISLYCDVSAPLEYCTHSDEVIVENSETLFEMRNNKLYLLTQSSQRMLILETAETFEWDIKKLADLKESQPSLLEYWPEPNSGNLGIKWLPIKEKVEP